MAHQTPHHKGASAKSILLARPGSSEALQAPEKAGIGCSGSPGDRFLLVAGKVGILPQFSTGSASLRKAQDPLPAAEGVARRVEDFPNPRTPPSVEG